MIYIGVNCVPNTPHVRKILCLRLLSYLSTSQDSSGKDLSGNLYTTSHCDEHAYERPTFFKYSTPHEAGYNYELIVTGCNYLFISKAVFGCIRLVRYVEVPQYCDVCNYCMLMFVEFHMHISSVPTGI